jgi:putative hydrolase of the HAD superfamily
MIRAIVFDAVGTLIHVRPSVASIYVDVGRRFGSRLSADEVRRRFPVAFGRQDLLDEQVGWRTSEERERQRWQQIVAEVLDDATDPRGCFEALFAAFGRPDAWQHDPHAEKVLADLHGRGYRLAMASNFDRRLHDVIAGMSWRPLLERVIVSSEIGWRKPASDFFSHLAGALDLPAADILFVGDDRSNDYDPARRAGMPALLLGPSEGSEVGVDRLEDLSALPRRTDCCRLICGGGNHDR